MLEQEGLNRSFHHDLHVKHGGHHYCVRHGKHGGPKQHGWHDGDLLQQHVGLDDDGLQHHVEQGGGRVLSVGQGGSQRLWGRQKEEQCHGGQRQPLHLPLHSPSPMLPGWK